MLFIGSKVLFNLCLIAASASQLAIIALLFFYNSKDLNCIRALFFKICSHIFEVKLEKWFLSRWTRNDFFHSNFVRKRYLNEILHSWLLFFVHMRPKQAVERKSEWFCGVNIFYSNFAVDWESGVWTKLCFLASGWFFHMRQFHSKTVFLLFGSFYFLEFFFKWFSQSIHSSFLA